jgi:hypothetical protein
MKPFIGTLLDLSTSNSELSTISMVDGVTGSRFYEPQLFNRVDIIGTIVEGMVIVLLLAALIV